MNKRWQVISAIIMLVALLISCAPPGGAPTGGSSPGGAAAPSGGTAAPSGGAAAPAETMAPSGGNAQQGNAGSGPIKVGVIAALTGTSAASGKDMVDGWNLFWEINGTNVAGREVQTLVEDGAGDPTVAVQKARQLVEQQQVNLIVGTLFANVGLAVADYMESAGVPAYYPIASADDLTQRTPKKMVLRVAGWSSSQPNHPFGEWAYDEGYRKILTICTDYAFGHEVCGGFVDAFTRKGGQVVKQLWNPIGTPDFSSYLAQMQSAGVDAVFSSQVGADSPRFTQQWQAFGLKDQIPLLGGEVLTDQSVLRSMGPEAVGIITAGHYAEGWDNKATQDFVEQYSAKYDRLPSYYAVAMFTAAQWLKGVVEEGNNPDDHTAFLEASKKFQLAETPMGPMRLDDYGNPVHPMFIRKVEQRPDGKLWNSVIKVYDDVSQFWTWDPAEYLKQPVYSRSFQGPQANVQ